MKKSLVGFLLGAFVLSMPIQASANGLSNIDTSESDGIPFEIREYAELCGTEYNICPELLEAIAYSESRYTADATNGSCYGLMQVNLTAHKDRIKKYGWTEEDMSDPYKNMMIASDYLAELFNEYEDVGKVLIVYNGNTSALPAYEQYGKLSSYANKILEKAWELEELHNKHELTK